MALQDDMQHPAGLAPVARRLPRWASLRTITALILREMSTTYGKSPGGYAWAVLEPALGLAVLVAVFSLGFRSPPLGDNFAIFYASGLLPFMLAMGTSVKVQQSINFSRQLLSYPRVTFLDALLARLILHVLTQLTVSVLLFGTILSVFETRTVLRLETLLNAYAMAIAVGFGIGVLNCVLVSRNQVWASIWSVITRPLFIVSGVIFLPEKIPQPYRGWLEWNPLLHVTGEARRAFYFSYKGEYVDSIYAYGVALICTVAGLLLLRSYYRDLMER
jgi:capsular polysaccharide transport system permease protein